MKTLQPQASPYVGGLLKRTLDVVASCGGLLITAPFLLAAALWVMAVNPGPLIFRQTRVGRDQRPFEILKLRTMTTRQSADTGRVTVKNDARLFRGAALIRALKIDELPQLVNILRGDMSLIGPRPTTADDYERMTPQQRARSLARPGLSGLAQISGNTSLSWPQRIALDLEYVENATLATDVKIVAATLWMIAAGRIDSHPASGDEWEA